MRVPLLGAFITGALAAISTPTNSAQIVVRQDEAPIEQALTFTSPMILDFPSPNLHALRLGDDFHLAGDLRKYRCEGSVFFYDLRIRKQTKDRKRSTLSLLLNGYISVLASYDRLVDVTLHIKKNNQILASGTALNIDAEELRNTKFSVTATISEPALEAAFAQGPNPTVEVVLRVHDNS